MEIELESVEEGKSSLYTLKKKDTGGGVHTSANLIFGQGRSSEVGHRSGNYFPNEAHPHDLALPKYYGRDTSNVQICILVIGILLVCAVIGTLVVTLWMFSSGDPTSTDSANLIEARKLSAGWLDLVQSDDKSWYPWTQKVVAAQQLNDNSWLNEDDYMQQLSVLQMNNEILALLKDSTKVNSWEIKNGTTVPVKELPNSITTSTFSSYINALVATCQDPTDFYGENLVHSLQYNLQLRAQPQVFDYATAVLALCNGGLESYNDLKNYIGDIIYEQLEDGSYEEDPIESTAMVAMALICTKDIPSDVNTHLDDALNYLISQQQEDGSCGNTVYGHALASQTFNADSISDSIKAKWDQNSALDWLQKMQENDGSYSNGSIVDTSIVLIALAEKFLGAAKSINCLYTIDSKGKEIEETAPISELINVNLIINNTLISEEAPRLAVVAENGWSILQVLEAAENLEYEVEADQIKSIEGVSNTDVESWSVLQVPLDPETQSIKVTSLQSTWVSDEDTLIFYYAAQAKRKR